MAKEHHDSDVDETIVPADRAVVIPPILAGISVDTSGEAKPEEPTPEDVWHFPEEDRETAVENARRETVKK